MSPRRWTLVLSLILMAWLLAHCTHAWSADNQGSLRGGFIIGSEHWSSEEHNERQNGIYLCYSAFCAGRYENSHSKVGDNPKETSHFVMYEYYLGSLGYADFTAAIGAVDGYKGYSTSNEWMPFGGLTARVSILKIWQMGRTTAYGVELWRPQ